MLPRRTKNKTRSSKKNYDDYGAKEGYLNSGEILINLFFKFHPNEKKERERDRVLQLFQNHKLINQSSDHKRINPSGVSDVSVLHRPLMARGVLVLQRHVLSHDRADLRIHVTLVRHDGKYQSPPHNGVIVSS